MTQDLLAGMRSQPVGAGENGNGQASSNGHPHAQQPMLRHQDLQALTLLDAIIFDHDGVCVNSEAPAMRSAWRLTQEVFRRKDILPPEEEAFMRLAGKPYSVILQNLQNGHGRILFTGAEIDLLREEEEQRAQAALRVEAKAIPGIVTVLDICRQVKVPYAMASSSIWPRIDVCTRTTDLDGYFPREIVFSAMTDFPTPQPKPNPAVYNKAIDYLRESTGKPMSNLAKVCAIEDSNSGVGAAVAAGVPYVVGFIGGDHIPVAERPLRTRQLMDLGCYTVIDDMHQFPSILVQIGTEIAVNGRR